MGKKKKKFKKKVNPEKSNKMIIAVVIGVVIVMAVFFLLMITSSGSGKVPVDKGELMKNTLKYLDKAEGISQLNYYPDQDKVVIVYEGYREDKQDFEKIARYAGIKLSHKMGDEVLTLVLAKDKEEQVTYMFTIKDGSVLSEMEFQ